MGLDFLVRVRKISIVSGLVLFAFVVRVAGVPAGCAWLLGLAWSLLNLYLIGRLVALVVVDGARQKRWIVATLLIKAPLLYLAGFLLFKSGLPAMGLLAGFMWPLSVIVLKSLGRMFLKLDEQRPASAGPNSI